MMNVFHVQVNINNIGVFNMSIFKRSESYRPFKYPNFVVAEQRHRIDSHWTEHQVDLSDDLMQYHSIDGLSTEDVTHSRHKLLLDKLLPLFTEMDSSVGEGYSKLLPHVGNNEVRSLLLTQAAREVTHMRGYALANETFGFPESSWVGFKEYKEMQDKIDTLLLDQGDLSDKLNWCKLLGQILLGEGIALFGSFACLLNLKRSGLLMGFNDVNSWSLNDENEHIINNISILGEARKDLDSDKNEELSLFLNICTQKYVEAEHKFIEIVYEDGELQGMSESDLKDYITYLGQFRLYQLGNIGYLEVPDNPMLWMDWMLSASKHDNFFEKKVTDYSHNGLEGSIDYTRYK